MSLILDFLKRDAALLMTTEEIRLKRTWVVAEFLVIESCCCLEYVSRGLCPREVRTIAAMPCT